MSNSDIYTIATNYSGLACPRCSSTHYHRHGRDLGIQRYQCQDCGRTFKETINTPMHCIHDKLKMRDYIITMCDRLSIRAAATKVGITTPTSFKWRHRILASLRTQTPTAGGGSAGICEIRLPHSFKGKSTIPDTQMPDTHTVLITDARGIPCLQLLNKPKKVAEASAIISSSLLPETPIATINANIITRATRKTPLRRVKNKTATKTLIHHTMKRVADLTCWMARFNGVATKYLQQYWNWYRAQCNTGNLSLFCNECLGQRQLPFFRQLITSL